MGAIAAKVAIQQVMILAQAATDSTDDLTKAEQIIEALNQHPIIGWVIAGFIVFAIAIAAIATLTGNLDKIFGFRRKYFAQSNTELSEKQLCDLRNQLLQIMKGDVAQRLEGSLHNLVKVDLKREEQLYQIGHAPIELVKEDPQPAKPIRNFIRRGLAVFKASEAIEPISSSEQTYSIFYRSDIDRRLLILGEPGAGKTTELLTVASRLIEEAIEDAAKPIPIIFELSSWTPEQPIIDWLGGQLSQKYGVSTKLSNQAAKQWVQHNTLLLLLDGLDELGQQNQIACIQAIEEFLSAHRALSAIICCRREEYEQGNQKLTQLKGAIYLQLLDSAQIHKYLGDLNRKRLWDNIDQQSELLELARSPLFLTMLVVVHEEHTIKDKAELFDAYIQKQLHEPSHQGTYKPGKEVTPEQVSHYLSWLAKQLEQRNDTEFLIENLQPDWLASQQQKQIYRLIVGLIFGLIFGLSFGLSSGLSSGLSGGLSGGLIFGLSSGLSGGLIFGLIGGLGGAIQHCILRIVLTKNGYTPWNYAKFLEHAIKHRFIQKTGGRYRFIHDLLRKHFAKMPSSLNSPSNN